MLDPNYQHLYITTTRYLLHSLSSKVFLFEMDSQLSLETELSINITRLHYQPKLHLRAYKFQFWECDSYKELLRHFLANALFCTSENLGKFRFFWWYHDPGFVTVKLTLEGFKIIIASFWIKNKLLSTSFESDFQRSFYVFSIAIYISKKL